MVTETTETYTLSLHDALPISDEHEEHEPEQFGVQRFLQCVVAGCLCELVGRLHFAFGRRTQEPGGDERERTLQEDRKSTRLNSSHANISYAVFCLKKKTNKLA